MEYEEPARRIGIVHKTRREGGMAENKLVVVHIRKHVMFIIFQFN